MKAKEFVNEGVVWLRPGMLRGSYTNETLEKFGFKKAENGNWYISQQKWDQLIRQGLLKE